MNGETDWEQSRVSVPRYYDPDTVNPLRDDGVSERDLWSPKGLDKYTKYNKLTGVLQV